jgi:2,4-diketo-3-deoxy-L-fuconate hydrolase
MKLCRFGEAGSESPGLVDSDGNIRDLSGYIPDINGEFLSSDGIEKLTNIDTALLPIVREDVRIGSPVGSVGKVVCAGMNYSDHCEEAGFPIPDQPALFMKATTSISGPNDPIELPSGASQVDWEIELAIVIGKKAKNVSEADALEHVAGYTILNDVSDRDFQFNHGGQWFKGKSADTFCPVGPWLVTADEIADPQNLELSLGLNGETMQSGSTAKMIFSVAELIAHTSKYMTLEPGDILSTGTPPGVGMGQKPTPRWLRSGDIVTLEIAGLGRQTQPVA